MTSTAVGYGEVDERLVAKAALDAAEEKLQSLCASHAGAFVSVERRATAVCQALEDLQLATKTAEPQVSHAQASLEQEEEDDTKSSSLAVVSERHRVRRRTLLQHSSLLELLELPSLMDACVRSNLYEQALAIAAFANTLERRHGIIQHQQESSAAAVVARVVSQIRSRQTDLTRHLLHRLKGHVTMPQCLEVVTALRRLNSIDLEQQGQQPKSNNLERIHAAMELRLQVDFLEARDAWLDSSAEPNGNNKKKSALPQASSASSEHLLDSIERYRTRCFEIATQFLAIFRASPGSTTTKDESSPASLLSMWTTRRVHSFLTMLSSQLDKMQDTAALRDALEACVFFATSMGRLGADFEALLPPLLEPKMLALVVGHWTDGVASLEDTLRTCRDAGVASPLISNTATMGHEKAPYVDGQTPPPPPRQLLAFPPLARFLNAYLTGLNELRRCLFLGIFASLRRALENVLENVHALLQTHERAVLTPGLRGEAAQLREVASQYKNVFAHLMEPYMRASLEVALGDFEAAQSILPRKKEVEEKPEELEQEEGEETGVESTPDDMGTAEGADANVTESRLEPSTSLPDAGDQGVWAEDDVNDVS